VINDMNRVKTFERTIDGRPGLDLLRAQNMEAG